ncbi:hypothetical protein G7Y89_g6202 [Cudoniella acicularis]|uniref:Uncharacterized protein n=1 Tax=Cudoniella acicularis TaxID=354080 RepID=A0A8H4W5R4_9HELO|nr:hypothetical protein G7Y89_g6202 [Cudoniella acicularis]
MANASHYVYLIQQQDLEDHTNQLGRLSIIGCYTIRRTANGAAKTEANRLYRDRVRSIADSDMIQTIDKPEESFNDKLYSARVYLYEDDSYPAREHVDITVAEQWCAAAYDLFGSDESGDSHPEESDEDDDDDLDNHHIDPVSRVSTTPLVNSSASVPAAPSTSRSNNQANNHRTVSTRNTATNVARMGSSTSA